MKGRKLNLAGRVFLAILTLASAAKISQGKGILDIIDSIECGGSQFLRVVHSVKPDAYEGVDKNDSVYDPNIWPSQDISSKIVSILETQEGKKELDIDVRPVDSNSTIDLELSLRSQSGSPITTNSTNELWCSLPLAYKGYDFSSKPITYWERDANDPNMFYLVANVRKEMSQNRGIIPLADLNGTYNSEEPYLHAQIRFNDHFVHLNDDNIVDLKDFSIFANAFGRTGITDTNRAEPNDLGAWADYDLDGDVDCNDLSIFTDYYLTSKKYHLEDGWILE